MGVGMGQRVSMKEQARTGFRVLRSESELNEYAEKTHRHLGVRFPLEYLKRSKVVAYLSDSGEMVGGYAMVLKGPFRTLESLPDVVRDCHPFLKETPMKDICEFTGLWLAPEMRRRTVSFVFWLRMYFDVVTLGKKHFVYAYSLDKKALGRMYRVCNPEVLFRGMTRMQPGMSKPEAESVEVTSLARIVWTPLLKPQFLLFKMIRRRTLSRNLAYMRIMRSNEG
jgi:hypothetical protein